MVDREECHIACTEGCPQYDSQFQPSSAFAQEMKALPKNEIKQVSQLFNFEAQLLLEAVTCTYPILGWNLGSTF